jgi:hypothetical protein
MNRAVIAALLSGLVFPGAGHLYLRRVGRGCLFVAATLAASYVYFGDWARRISTLVDQVQAGSLPADPFVIAERLHALGPGSSLVTACGWLLVVCWLGSIVDAFVLAGGAAPPAK